MNEVTGLCVDGPLEGMTFTTRLRSGIVVVDRLNHTMYTYRLTDDDTFVHQPKESPRIMHDSDDSETTWSACAATNYDIIACTLQEPAEVNL